MVTAIALSFMTSPFLFGGERWLPRVSEATKLRGRPKALSTIPASKEAEEN